MGGAGCPAWKIYGRNGDDPTPRCHLYWDDEAEPMAEACLPKSAMHMGAHKRGEKSEETYLQKSAHRLLHAPQPLLLLERLVPRVDLLIVLVCSTGQTDRVVRSTVPSTNVASLVVSVSLLASLTVSADVAPRPCPDEHLRLLRDSLPCLTLTFHFPLLLPYRAQITRAVRSAIRGHLLIASDKQIGRAHV